MRTIAACASNSMILRVLLLAAIIATAHSQSLLWNFNASYLITAGAVVSGDKLLVGSQDCRLYALDASNSGSLLWTYTLPTFDPQQKSFVKQPCKILSAPVVGQNSIVYLNSADGFLYALNAASRTSPAVKVWSFPDTASLGGLTSPVLSADGDVVYTCIVQSLFAIDAATGVKKWSASYAAQVSTTPALSNGNQVLGQPILFFGTAHGFLVALRASDGSQAWNYSVGTATGIRSSPTLGNHNGNTWVYFGCRNKNVYSLNASSGALEWMYPTSAEVRASPTLDDLNPDGPALYVSPLQCFGHVVAVMNEV